MAVSGVYDSAGYNFGSLASIRKQADAIKQRVGGETKARIEEQEKTGLIQNPDTGEMVELSSISEKTRERWNDRLEMRTVSPTEAMILFKAADPNAEEVEAAQARGAKFSKIQGNCLGPHDAGAVFHRQQNCVKRIDILLFRGAGIGQNI